jgi:hypothetical protein
MNPQGTFQKKKHPCDTINIIPKSLQQTPYTIQFNIEITSFTPCNYVIRIIEKASNKEIKDIVFSESKGIYTIRFENLVPGTDYWVVFYNLFNKKLTQLDYISVTTTKLVNTCGQITIVPNSLRITPFTLSFSLDITSDVPCYYRISAINTKENSVKYTDVSYKDKAIYPILFHSLTANTPYRIEFAMWNGNNYQAIPMPTPLILTTQQVFQNITSTDSTIDLRFTVPLEGIYTVYVKRAEDFDWIQGQPVALSAQTQLPLQYQIPNLLMNEEYNVYVEYNSGKGQTGRSEIAVIRTKEPIITIVNEEATFDSITVDFSVNSSDGEYSIGYKLNTEPDTSYNYSAFIPYDSQQKSTSYTIDNLQMNRRYNVVIVYRKNGKMIFTQRDINTLPPRIIISEQNEITDESIAFDIILPKQGDYTVGYRRLKLAGKPSVGKRHIPRYTPININTVMPIRYIAPHLNYDADYEFTVYYRPNGVDPPITETIVLKTEKLPYKINAVQPQKSSAAVILEFFHDTDIPLVDQILVKVIESVNVPIYEAAATEAEKQEIAESTFMLFDRKGDLTKTQDLISFSVSGLTENTNYTLIIKPYIRRGVGNTIARDIVAEFTTKYRRCTFRKDKVEVVKNRMKYSLNFSKIDHILRKLFHKIVTSFIRSSNPNIFTNYNINDDWRDIMGKIDELESRKSELSNRDAELNSIPVKERRWKLWKKEKADIGTEIARLDQQIGEEEQKLKEHKQLYEKYTTTKTGNRLALYENVFNQVRDFLRVHQGYSSPNTPLHIELYYLLLSEPRGDGDTRRFLDQFFPGMDARARYEYFSEGFPSDNVNDDPDGTETFLRFAKTLLNNQAEGDHILNYVILDENGNVTDSEPNPITLTPQQIADGYTTRLSPRKREPPLRAILRGPNYPNSSFGFIFLSDKPSSRDGRGVKDDMLVHLSIFDLYDDPVGKKDLFTVKSYKGKNVPVNYHTTDSCFNLHNYYKFEDDTELRRTGDFGAIRENQDGSLTFFHQNPGEADEQRTTVELDDNTREVTVTGAELGGGRYKKTRKIKKSKKRKTMRARKGKVSQKRKTIRGRRG